MKNIFKKNHIIITALAIMIVIAGYLSFTNRDAADKLNTASVTDPDTQDVAAVDGKDVVTNTDTTNTTTTDTTTNNVSPTVTATDTTNDTNTTTDTTTDKNATDKQSTGDLGKNDISDEDSLANAKDVSDNGELDLEDGVPGEAVLASASNNSGYFISSKVEREQVRSQSRETLMQIINSKDASDEAKKKATNSLIELTELAEKERATEIMLGAKGFEDAVVYIAGKDVNVVVNAKTLSKQQLAIIENVVKENTDFTVDHINISPIVNNE